jgi:hypothetical protein
MALRAPIVPARVISRWRAARPTSWAPPLPPHRIPVPPPGSAGKVRPSSPPPSGSPSPSMVAGAGSMLGAGPALGAAVRPTAAAPAASLTARVPSASRVGGTWRPGPSTGVPSTAPLVMSAARSQFELQRPPSSAGRWALPLIVLVGALFGSAVAAVALRDRLPADRVEQARLAAGRLWPMVDSGMAALRRLPHLLEGAVSTGSSQPGSAAAAPVLPQGGPPQGGPQGERASEPRPDAPSHGGTSVPGATRLSPPSGAPLAGAPGAGQAPPEIAVTALPVAMDPAKTPSRPKAPFVSDDATRPRATQRADGAGATPDGPKADAKEPAISAPPPAQAVGPAPPAVPAAPAPAPGSLDDLIRKAVEKEQRGKH